jgi:shikimate kinase
LTEKNIGLIGFMGTGKTSIGRALANSLDRQFFDTDMLIETAAGKKIPQIFKEEGEESFRILESKVVTEVCGYESAVISFGGGVVLSKSNVEVIRHSNVVVLLRSSVETIIKRTRFTEYRPLLDVGVEDVESRIRSLMASRKTLYESAMDFAIDTDILTIDEVVEEITERVRA